MKAVEYKKLGLAKSVNLDKGENLKQWDTHVDKGDIELPLYLVYSDLESSSSLKNQTRLEKLYKLYVFYGMEDYEGVANILQSEFSMSEPLSAKESVVLNRILTLYSLSFGEEAKKNQNPLSSAVLKLSFILLTIDSIRHQQQFDDISNNLHANNISIVNTFLNDHYSNYKMNEDQRMQLPLTREEEIMMQKVSNYRVERSYSTSTSKSVNDFSSHH